MLSVFVRRISAVGAFGCALQLAAVAPASSADLVSHRATYELRLSPVKRAQGIVDVRGRMVSETIDACEGWETSQRIKLSFLRTDSEEFTTDSGFAAYESKDGLVLQFSVRNAQNGEIEEEVRGQATLEAIGGKGEARFTLPEVRTYNLPAGTLFPTAHLNVLIEAARAGDKLLGARVFDGARLDGAFQVNAVIGRPPRSAAAPMPRGDVALLRNQPSWLIRLAFFPPGAKESQPEYEIGAEILANGIARSMTLDYGDFAIDARLLQLEALPRPKCS
jgi:hypothetical protein